MKIFRTIFFAALAAPVFGQYAWYFTDPMQSLQTADWTTSATPQFSNYGTYWGAYANSSPNYTSMVSSVHVPDGTSSYGIQATVHFPSGGTSGGISLLLKVGFDVPV